MQFEIADDVASTFAHEFYGALADGYPIDAAVTEARKAIFAAGHEVEWATPVLYLRAPDGRIFDVDRGHSLSRSKRPPRSETCATVLIRDAGVALAHGKDRESHWRSFAGAPALDPGAPNLRSCRHGGAAARGGRDARSASAPGREHVAQRPRLFDKRRS